MGIKAEREVNRGSRRPRGVGVNGSVGDVREASRDVEEVARAHDYIEQRLRELLLYVKHVVPFAACPRVSIQLARRWRRGEDAPTLATRRLHCNNILLVRVARR